MCVRKGRVFVSMSRAPRDTSAGSAMDIIVCDDHPVVRQGLTRIILRAIKGGRVREVDNAQSLLDLVRRSPSDIVVLDLGLSGRSGLDVLRQIKQERPGLPVLVLTVHPADQYALRTLRAGAAGFLSKRMAADELVNAVRVVAGGQRYLTPDVANRLAEFAEHPNDRPLHEGLSDREFEILCLIGEGQETVDIAASLCLSVSTVGTYRGRIRTKLGLKTEAQLIHYAVRNGLV